MRRRSILLAILLLTSCPLGTPSPSNVTIDFGHMKLDLGASPGHDIDRSFQIYAGGAVDSFTIALDVVDLPDGASIGISSGDGAHIETVGRIGRHTTLEIPGNVAGLRVQSPGTRAPVIFIDSLAAHRPGGIHPPRVEPHLTDNVAAFPLQLGQPVDVGFPADATAYAFSISGLSAQSVDVFWFGAGRLRIAAPNSGEFPLDDAGVWEQIPRSGWTTPFTRIDVGDMGELRLDATNEGAQQASGHGRILVMAISPPQPLAFPSRSPWNFIDSPMGVDHDSSHGTGPFSGKLDCTNFQGKKPIALVPGTSTWVMKPGIPVCYDDHPGTDFLLRGSAIAQAIGVGVSAAADGVVIGVDATHADNCFYNVVAQSVTCPGESAPVDNYVAVRQNDGLIAYYVHERRGSPVVVPGQRVACGEALMLAGSAGDSAMPHLHFELCQLHSDAFRHLATVDLGAMRDQSDTIDPYGGDGASSRWRALTGLMPQDNCP